MTASVATGVPSEIMCFPTGFSPKAVGPFPPIADVRRRLARSRLWTLVQLGSITRLIDLFAMTLSRMIDN
jgi:hypothetical protein